jgi:hypothetical protein
MCKKAQMAQNEVAGSVPGAEPTAKGRRRTLVRVKVRPLPCAGGGPHLIGYTRPRPLLKDPTSLRRLPFCEWH